MNLYFNYFKFVLKKNMKLVKKKSCHEILTEKIQFFFLLQVVAGILLHGLTKLFGIQPHILLPFMTCLLRPGICTFVI